MTTEEKTTSRQRYDARKRAEANERPGLLKEIAELSSQIATLIQVVQDRDGEIVQLKTTVSSHESRIIKLETDNAKMMAFIKEQTG